MFSQTAKAQTNSNIIVYSSVWVGCSTGQNIGRKTFAEYISEGLCLQQCKNNRGNFNINSYPYPPTNTVWTVTGGVIQTQDADNCKIVWGASDSGSITVTTVVNGVTISYPTLCVDLKKSPSSSFTVAPATAPIATPTYKVCQNQTINFTDLSIANGGTPINNRVWDFGDGTFSSEINPSHTYSNYGAYKVTNYISNECNCNSTAELIVEAKNQSVDITCPSVVCQGDKTNYTIGAPFDHEGCTNYDWSVTGGTIVSQAPYANNIDVLWDNIRNNDGFGYVRFNPSTCNTGCYSPTTIKVPIIKSDYQPIMWEGAALNSDLNNIPDLIIPVCGSTQQKFKMPQWPSTEFTWEIINTATAPPTTTS